ncbi:hypothetical protein B1B_01738 [mine drainage metagenome]|uniref:YicC family protein n=2 Tax=mine drainage metagenome TaxID=410659 RepID=T1D1S8_9ZZZZ
MTGYARVVSARSGVNLTWFLKSLNGRSRDILLRTPPIFDQFVNRFRSVLSSHPVRGRLEAELQTCPAGMEDSGTEINWLRIAEIRSWIETIRQNWDLGMSVDPLALLQWPGVLVRKEPDVSLEVQACEAQELLITALGDLERMQAEEGERLAVGLVARVEEMAKALRDARQRVDLSQAEQVNRLRRRMESIRADLDPARLEQELVLLVQKTDVSEELDRIESHLAALASTLETGLGGGRKLDFLLQEMQREVNTLSAKVQNAEISHQMVDLKVVVEQMREQVQNIG